MSNPAGLVVKLSVKERMEEKEATLLAILFLLLELSEFISNFRTSKNIYSMYTFVLP